MSGDGTAKQRCALGLTALEHRVLARLMLDNSRHKCGNGPWERSWYQAHNSVDGRALAELHRRGLIERHPSYRPSAKIAPRYRWRREP